MDNVYAVFEKDTDASLYILDQFPFLFDSNEKLLQIEGAFGAFWSPERRIFNRREKKIIDFVTLLWAYSTVQICIGETFLRTRAGLSGLCETDMRFPVKDVKFMQRLCRLACREKAFIYVSFQNFRGLGTVYMELFGVYARLYIENQNLKEDVEKIALSCGLFLRQ